MLTISEKPWPFRAHGKLHHITVSYAEDQTLNRSIIRVSYLGVAETLRTAALKTLKTLKTAGSAWARSPGAWNKSKCRNLQ